MLFTYLADKSHIMLLFVMRTSSWIGVIILGLIAVFLWKFFMSDSEE